MIGVLSSGRDERKSRRSVNFPDEETADLVLESDYAAGGVAESKETHRSEEDYVSVPFQCSAGVGMCVLLTHRDLVC